MTEIEQLEKELSEVDLQLREAVRWRGSVRGRNRSRTGPLHGTGESTRRSKGASSYDNTSGDLWDVIEQANQAPGPVTGPPRSTEDFEIEYDLADKEVGFLRHRRSVLRQKIRALRTSNV